MQIRAGCGGPDAGEDRGRGRRKRLRNEANLVLRGRLRAGGRRQDRGRLGRDGRLRAGGIALGLNALDVFECAVDGTLGGIEAALEAFEGVAGGHEDVGDGGWRAEGGAHLDEAILVHLDFDAAVAAELPLGGDEQIDERALSGVGGLVLLVVFGNEGIEHIGIFAGEDFGLGVNAGFESVETGGGLALDGAGAGGFLRITAIRFDLWDSSHGFRPRG